MRIHKKFDHVPIGIPLVSVCWKDRRDWSVGFSSAAATIQLLARESPCRDCAVDVGAYDGTTGVIG